MARPNIELLADKPFCKRVAITSRKTRYSNPIGTICQRPGTSGYTYTTVVSAAPRKAKTRHQAVLRVVKEYQRWMSFSPGRLRIEEKNRGVRGGKTARCKNGRVKSGPRKGMCRLRPKRRK